MGRWMDGLVDGKLNFAPPTLWDRPSGFNCCSCSPSALQSSVRAQSPDNSPRGQVYRQECCHVETLTGFHLMVVSFHALHGYSCSHPSQAASIGFWNSMLCFYSSEKLSITPHHYDSKCKHMLSALPHPCSRATGCSSKQRRHTDEAWNVWCDPSHTRGLDLLW